MLTPSNKPGRRCGARRRWHAVVNAAVFVAAILAALWAVAARVRALSSGSHPKLSPQEPRQARSFPRRPWSNEVPAEYHLMTVGAAAAGCPRVVDISFSDRPAPDQPLQWGTATKMAMPMGRRVFSTRMWYVAPSGALDSGYRLGDKPELNTRKSPSRSFEIVWAMLTVVDGFFPHLG